MSQIFRAAFFQSPIWGPSLRCVIEALASGTLFFVYEAKCEAEVARRDFFGGQKKLYWHCWRWTTNCRSIPVQFEAQRDWRSRALSSLLSLNLSSLRADLHPCYYYQSIRNFQSVGQWTADFLTAKALFSVLSYRPIEDVLTILVSTFNSFNLISD